MEKVYIAGAIPEVGLNLLKEHFEVEMMKVKMIKMLLLLIILSTNVDQEVIK